MIGDQSLIPLKVIQHPFGREILFKKCRLFFGNRFSSREVLKNHFQELEFCSLKQVHGSEIVEGSSDPVTSDGHWTIEPHRALMIITADCMPVLFWTQNNPLIGAVHAGWRGVVSEIVPKMMKLFIQKGIEVSSIGVAIGAHIRQSSFLVNTDVRDPLVAIAQKYSPNCEWESIVRVHSASQKFAISLQEIVLRQLESYNISRAQIWRESEDTFADNNFQSYRRDGGKAERQFSFISAR